MYCSTVIFILQSLCEPCFSPVYDIVHSYVKLYHTAISQHVSLNTIPPCDYCSLSHLNGLFIILQLLKVIGEGLENNEIVTLLNWISTY